MTLWTLVFYALAAGRMALGLAPILAAGPASRLLGFPEDHQNPSARLFGRLFGVRDIGLGVLVLAMMSDPEYLRWALLFNAFHDMGDMLVIAVPLLKRQGIDKAAALSLGFAFGGCCCWILAWGFYPG